jgi:hypothetical protein
MVPERFSATGICVSGVVVSPDDGPQISLKKYDFDEVKDASNWVKLGSLSTHGVKRRGCESSGYRERE